MLGDVILGPIISVVEPIALSIIMGVFGNYFYIKHVDEAISQSEHMDNQEWMYFVSKNGGTSVGMALIPLGVAVLAAIIIAIYITSVLFSLFS